LRPDAIHIARMTIVAVCVPFLVSIAGAQDLHQPDSLNARLLSAARTGDISTVRRLLKQGADLEARDEGGRTALARAADCGDTEIVKLLLAKGADPEAGQIVGEEVLRDATKMGNARKVKPCSISEHSARQSTKR
jgi:ankyrin repeat protein